MVKRKYINFKVEDDLPGVISLPEQGRALEPFNVRCGRCMRFCGFCCVCTGTLFQALAPWMLSVIEVLSLLLLYGLLVLPYRPPGHYAFDFQASTEDVVLLGGIRAATLAATYAWGSTRQHLRPYLYSSYVCGGVVLLYVCLKAWLFSYPLAWLAPAALMTTCAAFSCLDVLAARYTVHWYRRRGQLGLLHSRSLPPSSNRRRALAGSPAIAHASLLDSGGGDLPPEQLADPDSRFLDVDGVRVHYKEALPAAAAHDISATNAHQQQQPSQSLAPASPVGTGATAAAPPTGRAASAVAHADAALSSGDGAPTCVTCAADVAIVLLHGFAGGEFAWRHLLQPLADTVGARVLALDRPGFGLTTCSPDATFAFAGSRGMQPRQRHSYSSTLTQPLLLTHHLPHMQPSSGPAAPTLTQPGQATSGDGASHYQQEHQKQQQVVASCSADPYSLAGQACMVLRFCQLLGIRRVLLVAHSDGCAVAAHAAAAAVAVAGQGSLHAAGAAVAIAGQSNGQFQAQAMLQQQQVQGQVNRQGSNTSSTSGNSSDGSTSRKQRQVHVLGPQGTWAGSSSRGSGRGSGTGTGSAAVSAQDSEACTRLVEPAHSKQASAGDNRQSRCGVLVPPLTLTHCSTAASTVTSSSGGQEVSRQQRTGCFGISACAVCATGGSTSSSGSRNGVEVMGLVLLHPNLMGHQLPAGVTWLLSASGLGRSVLKSLLRSEVAQFINPRAWADPALVTDEVLFLYHRALRVEGWEQRLLSACSATAGSSLRKLAVQLEAVQHVPALLITGESDAVATPDRLAGIAAVLCAAQCAVVPNCGHLSHEEAPQQLLELLVPFCRQHLSDSAAAGVV